MKNQLEELLSKEMSRKEFLQHVGSGMLILFGISGLLKALTNTHQPQLPQNGYGVSSYGGKK